MSSITVRSTLAKSNSIFRTLNITCDTTSKIPKLIMNRWPAALNQTTSFTREYKSLERDHQLFTRGILLSRQLINLVRIMEPPRPAEMWMVAVNRVYVALVNRVTLYQ